jgi:hypothetical protein
MAWPLFMFRTELVSMNKKLMKRITKITMIRPVYLRRFSIMKG